jgi:hypothetical protein
MLRPRIFISHSNNDDATPPYLDSLTSTLTAANFDVLLDRHRLQPGAEWRRDIYSWMGICHAAIILLSKAANHPNSIWVPRETNILLWRRTIDPSFVVLPVCIGALTRDDLRTGPFADTRLEELQFLPTAPPATLSQDVLARLRPLLAPKTPLETLAARIAELTQGTDLRYTFAVCRFVHYLKFMMSDKIGSFMSNVNRERFLNQWLESYVASEPDARRPLAEARVEIPDDGSRAMLSVRPGFQLEELLTPIRVEFDLPKYSDLPDYPRSGSPESLAE